ncbi:MAG: hypothetical protein GXP26_10390 [Planctomycetes bacterium]|nr:hypothetical protein [Planctomycetota bacterium]
MAGNDFFVRFRLGLLFMFARAFYFFLCLMFSIGSGVAAIANGCCSLRRGLRFTRFFGMAFRPVACVLLAVAMLTTVGCGGCDTQPVDAQAKKLEEEKKKKEDAEKKKKLPVEIGELLPQLGRDLESNKEAAEVGGDTGARILVKPGHWTPTVQRMKANYEDFVGRSSVALLDGKNQPTVLRNTRYSLLASRPIALAKGRAKLIESELFVPEQTTGKRVRAALVNRESGREMEGTKNPILVKMPSYQYYVVVLAKEVSRYGYLKVTDTVRAPWEEEFDVASAPHYRVVLADATKEIPLSVNMLAWSSIAYLFWDEVDPTRLSVEQQEALVDWVHWGGRLIINGPDSLETLRGSFLDDWLPAESGGPRMVTAADLLPWSNYWAKRSQGKQLPTIKLTQPWSGIRLKPKDNARELAGGAGLFYELGVGQGSVVVSAVQLAERDLVNWKAGYDSFLNAGLLRRPRRQFAAGVYDGSRVGWADFAGRRLDAHFITGLRMFARDAATKANFQRIETVSSNQFGMADTSVSEKIDRPGGVGAWNPTSPISVAAREVLEEATAVRIPSAGFVVACLAAYLVVLVPLNWMVFRTLQRVEWAWIAAPIIALLGTYAIVRMVQLDIGFVRSQTEVALLELHGNYDRGLLSRYTSLYSSLSTTYDIGYEHPTAVALPFPSQDGNPLKIGDSSSQVVFEKNRETHLRGLTVSSVSRRTVRSEEMFEFEGTLRLGVSSRGHPQVENFTGLNLHNVAVIHRSFDQTGKPQYRGSWIGDLRSNDSAVLGLTALAYSTESLPFAEELKEAVEGSETDFQGTDSLLKLAFRFPQDEDLRRQRQEEYRLVAVLDEVLPGTEVSPAASQIRGVTIVLAHLEFGDLPQPLPDVNSREDVVEKKEEL